MKLSSRYGFDRIFQAIQVKISEASRSSQSSFIQFALILCHCMPSQELREYDERERLLKIVKIVFSKETSSMTTSTSLKSSDLFCLVSTNFFTELIFRVENFGTLSAIARKTETLSAIPSSQSPIWFLNELYDILAHYPDFPIQHKRLYPNRRGNLCSLESLQMVVDIPNELIRMMSDLSILYQEAGLAKPGYVDPEDLLIHEGISPKRNVTPYSKQTMFQFINEIIHSMRKIGESKLLVDQIPHFWPLLRIIPTDLPESFQKKRKGIQHFVRNIHSSLSSPEVGNGLPKECWDHVDDFVIPILVKSVADCRSLDGLNRLVSNLNSRSDRKSVG
jgi:hypothetical protein